MKKQVFVVLAMTICLMMTHAVLVSGHEDIKRLASCQYCGMDREKFAHSRIIIEYDDGSVVGACSIHCAAVDLATNIDKTPKAILVGDYGTKNLIDAEKAVWVVGGSKMGVMTRKAKWAFEKKEDAEKFIAGNGDAIAVFDEVMKTVYEDMYQDTKMIRERRKMMKKMATEHRNQ